MLSPRSVGFLKLLTRYAIHESYDWSLHLGNEVVRLVFRMEKVNGALPSIWIRSRCC